MKAFVLRSYGSPDVLRLTDVDTPVPGPHEVLIRIRATSVQPWDWHGMRGEPYVARVMPGGLGLRPKKPILGADVAGVVEAVGERVTEYVPGDEVFALPEGGGFAEYVSVPERQVAPKPRNLSFEQAAAVPLAACTALLAVRDDAKVGPGHRVLVNGASGGVGTFAVQLAKAYGAHVTGVCSTRHVDLVRSIGADEVIDYTKEDFTRMGPPYDAILYVAGNRSFAECRRVLKRKGVCVMLGAAAGRWVQPAGRMFTMVAASMFASQKAMVTQVIGNAENRRNLRELTELIESGQVTPVVDRAYAFADTVEAVRYQEEGHASGKVVITI
ncbi:NAD(P)-dependent alcohol dehydrogenase [Nonomuraea sp. NPDC048882]|uniref:NAD(P)-dependent alcohol dehydrogenase n=1 Tax=Nonomuraea sp. NPDC048882 TaxID=3154347 RepID=UPI0033D56156